MAHSESARPESRKLPAPKRAAQRDSPRGSGELSWL